MSKKDLPEMPYWDGPLSHPFYSKVVKRILDLVLAVILLIPALVLMLPLAVWVKLDSKGPVFYKAVRGGYHNQPFMIWKFRSMVVDADKTGGCTAKNDARVTRASFFAVHPPVLSASTTMLRNLRIRKGWLWYPPRTAL